MIPLFRINPLIIILTYFRINILFVNTLSNNPSKITAMLFSVIAVIVTSVLMYFIVCFERDNHNRTLINQLVSSVMWCGLFWNVVIQPTAFIRYIIGPIDSTLLCGIDTVLRNTVCMHTLLLFDSIIIVRYLFLFHLKNPTALQDAFWKVLLNIWIFSASLLLQCVYMILPGKNPINFYMCVGKYPVRFQNIPIKMNFSLFILAMLSGFVHLFVGLFKIKYNLKNNLNDAKSLYTFTSNTIGTFSLLASSIIIPMLVNKMEPDELDTYPNYLLLYIFHHYLIEFYLIVICVTYFCNSKALRMKFLADLKVFLSLCKTS